MNKQIARLLILVAIAAYGACSFIAISYADTLQSPNYKINESTVGSGGLVQSNSANFQAIEALGDTAVGNSASSGFQINSGSVTTGSPALSFGITNPNANFTDFSPAVAATATTGFAVSDYTSYGYAVQIVGQAPSNGGHTIATMPTTDISRPGQEQFGINLVHNTSPINFGADPDHGQFGVGSATANYGTANTFRYVDGETIATAPKSSGITNYTISYIINVTSLTPGGKYLSAQSLICTATY